MADHNDSAGATGVGTTSCLRPDRETDDAAFRAIFVALRRAPMDDAGFDEATVERLVQHQFDLQRAGFRYSCPLAESEAIVVGGEVVGRLITDDNDDHVVLVDLMIDPAHQRQGSGSRVLAEVVARAGSRPIELRLGHGSPAEEWCRRHGFERVANDDTQVHFVRVPPAAAISLAAV